VKIPTTAQTTPVSVTRRSKVVAWALGLGGVVACIAAACVVLAFGAPSTFLVTYLVGVVLGLIGAVGEALALAAHLGQWPPVETTASRR